MNTNNADAVLNDAVSNWLEARATYLEAHASDAPEEVTTAANAEVERLETEVYEIQALTMKGISSKLAIVEHYLKAQDDDGAADRASAMSLSLAEDLIEMSHALALQRAA